MQFDYRMHSYPRVLRQPPSIVHSTDPADHRASSKTRTLEARLLRAISCRDFGTTRHLLQDYSHQIDVEYENSRGFTAMKKAAQLGCLDTIRLLVSLGADVNNRGGKSGTRKNKEICHPLWMAAESQQGHIVAYLLKKGADVNYQTSHGHTALMRAVQKNSVSTVQFLLSNPYIDVDATNVAEQTALILACWSMTCPKIIFMLCQNGADTNWKGPHGTPLVQVCTALGGDCGKTNLATVLCAFGADPRIKFNGLSPQDYARGDWGAEALGTFLERAEIDFSEKKKCF